MRFRCGVTSLRLRFHRSDTWPALSWLARCRPGDEVVDVIHGTRVEAAPDWFCEAVWDGAYENGDFDRTDIVFGSGGRARDGGITFVSSGATVDRLQTMESGEEVWVSNSLPCLLAISGGQLDPAYPHYFRDFSSIRLGLSRYASQVVTNRGIIRLTYFNNVVWDGQRLRTLAKPNPSRDFGTFERYRGFLEATLQRVGRNLTASARQYPYRFLGTISSGYDSPAVAALARQAGLQDVISFDDADAGESDSGQEIATRLGLRVNVVARDGWRASRLAEVPFLAGDAKGEDVYFKSAEGELAGSALLTGFHGDKIWDQHTTALGPDLVRGDQSGLSLTEYRLRAGFIHCPVPFMGVRQIRDINRLSRSSALSPWDIGGHYTRPICRRIVEEAGVPRELFGIRKRASSVLFFHGSSFLTPEAMEEYLPWLETHLPPMAATGRSAARAQLARLTRSVERFASTRRITLLEKMAHRIAGWADREPLFRWVFPWAVERARGAYIAA